MGDHRLKDFSGPNGLLAERLPPRRKAATPKELEAVVDADDFTQAEEKRSSLDWATTARDLMARLAN